MSAKRTRQKEVTEHEECFFHIRKKAAWCLLGTIVFGLLSYYNLLLIDFGIFTKPPSELVFTKPPSELVFGDLRNVHVILVEYLLLSGFIISLAGFFKGGYDKLKTKDGLIFGLIFGLGNEFK